MVKSLIFILGTFAFSLFLAPFFIHFLYRFNFREEIRPEGPKTHLKKQGTPTMGGILFLVPLILITLVFNRTSLTLPLLALVLGAAGLGAVEDLAKIYHRTKLRAQIRQKITPIVTLSDLSWDVYKLALFPWRAFKEVFRALGSWDTVGLKSYQKILLETALGLATALWLYSSLGKHTLWLPPLGSVHVGWFLIPLFVFTSVFFVNAVNITDGLDGLLGGLALICFLVFLILSLVQGKADLALFSATLAGTLLCYLYFNIYPARVFMGNVGSLPLGVLFVTMGFLLDRAIILPLLGGIFVAEALSDIIQVGSVKLGRGRVFKMAPLHHHFELSGWPETKVTMRFWLFGLISSLGALLLALL